MVVKRPSHHPFRKLTWERSAERLDVMNITRKIATVAVAALALGGAGAGTAFAAGHGPAKAQHASSVRAGTTHAKAPAKGEDNNGENGNDGPGGHADPSGNVDHQFNGVE
jgi:hypothetical protein